MQVHRSSTIPSSSQVDISLASHNYDTSSSIHKFDITRHTTSGRSQGSRHAAWLDGPQECGTADDDPPSWFKFQMDVLEQTLRVL